MLNVLIITANCMVLNKLNVYAESGVLLARCLTSVSAYNRQVPNAKAKATGILQNLSNNYNHAGAKHIAESNEVMLF